ncbi:hypothetical protein CFP71_13455 [Amycolatopsis thailandensis]|uniref:ATPase AAA-type core domain-containing protein n=1 Tax=Amycolatopsis thailandensis TaxID=589330 RepID=A0A229SCI3_9PSEU|nr:AAA family ATPase [Amycolatopsis thailandensis]OXM56429.1 hypothetical protein CFP71_13455 [Amycolatopsis thailandensis]
MFGTQITQRPRRARPTTAAGRAAVTPPRLINSYLRKRALMPASTIVSSGGLYRFFDDSVQTYTRLPVATYSVVFDKLSGHSLRQTDPLAPGDETVYGSHARRVDRILRGYERMNRSVGAILSGDKGMGKSLMLRMLAEKARHQLDLPTILVQDSTPGLASFLDELGEVAVIFDEFEKIFPLSADDESSQTQFLSLFDGVSTTKRLYIVSVNNLNRVNEFMLNRPGRFHYHLRFTYPDPDTVATYLRDQVPGITQTQVDEVVEFSRKYDTNFDHLRAIAFELDGGEKFKDVVGDLNIKRPRRSETKVEARITWHDGGSDVISGTADLFDLDSWQTVTDHNLELALRFRMCDAVPTATGFDFPDGAYELTDVGGPFDEKGTTTSEQTAVSVTLSRARARSLDF